MVGFLFKKYYRNVEFKFAQENSMPTRIKWFNILPCSFGVGDEVAEHRRATMKMTAIMTSFMIPLFLLWTAERQRLLCPSCVVLTTALLRSMARCS